MQSRFDLEQKIMNTWHVVDDIDMLIKSFDKMNNLTEDQFLNILIGLKDLYNLKFEDLFECFEQCIKDKQI